MFTIFIVPSTLCSIFNIYYLLTKRTYREELSNHVIIFILIFALFFTLTDTVWCIFYYHTNSSLLSTPAFCLTWIYLDFAVFTSVIMLTAWASIERHMLIFHQNFSATPLRRLMFHYVPLMIFAIYPFIYYFIVFFLIPCDIPFDYNQLRCGIGSCAYVDTSFALWDSIVNSILPIFAIVLFSFALIVRVWYSKYRMGQRFPWRNYRKMLFQLLSISFLYFVLAFPAMVLYTAYTAGVSYDVGADFFEIGIYLISFIALLTPFVLIVLLPEFRATIRKIIGFFRREKHAVVPQAMPINRLRDYPGVYVTRTDLF
ncbi:unnamed protein product [Adineta ricciae]|uniref:G-protein coupled receptors family 1 profile domain-containing protein n=1 Tax=Adineta ricciae TaxID=249248 RepID=A0A815LJ24_ADIRI|nr:unnamed protein product [Adineta ricciae]